MRQNRRPHARTIASVVIPESNDSFPVIALPSGAERVIIKVRTIPHLEMCEVTTLPDAMDGNVSRTLRVRSNTPVVRTFFVRAPRAEVQRSGPVAA